MYSYANLLAIKNIKFYYLTFLKIDQWCPLHIEMELYI